MNDPIILIWVSMAVVFFIGLAIVVIRIELRQSREEDHLRRTAEKAVSTFHQLERQLQLNRDQEAEERRRSLKLAP